MSLALWVGSNRYEIGSASFLKAFFSTVFVRLEHGNWGSLYPVMMRGLYSGHLAQEESKKARQELDQIRRSFATIAPEQVVWDFEDSGASPPWGAEISDEIKSLADYFVTSDGRDLFEVLAQAIEEARGSGNALEIR